MADPGTLVGIISLGIQVADSLVKYYTAYKDRESDTDHTIKRLSHLLTVLEILRKQLADREFRPDEQSLLRPLSFRSATAKSSSRNFNKRLRSSPKPPRPALRRPPAQQAVGLPTLSAKAPCRSSTRTLTRYVRISRLLCKSCSSKTFAASRMR